MFSALKLYDCIEVCCDESCSKIHTEMSCFLLGLGKKSVNVTQKHKMDVSQIFIGCYRVFQEKHLPQKCSLQNYDFLEWNLTANTPNSSVLPRGTGVVGSVPLVLVLRVWLMV